MSDIAEQPTPLVVRGSTLRSQVKDAIEDLIVYGTLAPGEHVVEGALAERLGVSRQPVRESLQMLAGAGFINLVSGRGAFVHRPTPRQVMEVFHVRAVLEADSAALAARSISPDIVEQLADIVERGSALASGGNSIEATEQDSRALLDLNATFHDLVTAAGGNRVARRILDDLERRIAWFLATIIAGRAASSWTEHAEILDALRAGDAQKASDRTRNHVLRSLELIEFAI
ncbi:GntR family transcriptional regulator [Paramicrobacterium chengjingii]|uniref:GntR family transcriptional regulator n=1 Tax=Paramicrobacterium chengjingii TaxID=2769067 RepID=UPI00141D891E|nr:GntR family transcriptional regulator [Microbacterium chengjingii]